MKTRCPHCDTLYHIDTSTLSAADYTAVCCQCHRVFTAEPDEEQEQSSLLPPEADELPELLADIDEVAEVVAQASEQQAAEPTEDEWSFLQQKNNLAEDQPAPSLSLDVPDDFTSLAASELPAHHVRQTVKSRNKPGPLLVTGVLLLLLGALAQFAWINKQQLLDHPQGRLLAQKICSFTGCELEQKTALDKFTILHRDLQPAVGHNNALSLSLSFSNSANFNQPLPRLQLSFLDQGNKLLAQRSFSPQEYLYPDNIDDRSIAPKEIINLELLLQGQDTTGFRLKFL